MILSAKKYNNESGHFIIPVTWREEFKMESGSIVGIDQIGDLVIIDKGKDRKFNRVVTGKGFITIPQEIRQNLIYKSYNIFIIQKDEKILLTPINK